MKKILVTFLILVSLNSFAQENKSISDYLDVLEKTGQEPDRKRKNLIRLGIDQGQAYA